MEIKLLGWKILVRSIFSTALPTLTISDFWVEVAIGEEFPIKDDTVFAKAESCAADIEESLLVPIGRVCTA